MGHGKVIVSGVTFSWLGLVVSLSPRRCSSLSGSITGEVEEGLWPSHSRSVPQGQACILVHAWSHQALAPADMRAAPPDQAYQPGRRVRARAIKQRPMDGLAVCTLKCAVLPDQAFRPGRCVRARVIGQRLMDGLAVCTLKASAVEAGALSYADIAPGSLIAGTVDKVEDFGMFVKLAPGIKYDLPPLVVPRAGFMHMLPGKVVKSLAPAFSTTDMGEVHGTEPSSYQRGMGIII